MGNKLIHCRIAAVFTALILGVIIFFVGKYSISSDSLENFERSLNSLRLHEISRMRGRLLANDSLEQQESDFCDLTGYKDVLIPEISPCKRSDTRRPRYPAVCEIIIDREGGLPIAVRFALFGNGPSLYYDFYGNAFIRSGRVYPSQKDKISQPDTYVDEGLNVNGLIESVLNKDEQGIAAARRRLFVAICGHDRK
jgi:hypothetical protein